MKKVNVNYFLQIANNLYTDEFLHIPRNTKS